MKEKKIIKEVELFLKNLKNEGLSLITIKKKEQNLKVFLNWLSQEKLINLKCSEISKKHLLDFKKHLVKEEIKEETVDNYLKIIHHLLEYTKCEKQENDIQKIVNHYFETKGYTLDDIKEDAKKRKIVYSRYTRPAKDLLQLAGSVEKAKDAISKVALWASTRNLDYAIETVFKKWPEINKLKAQKKETKPYYRGDPMIWAKTKNKWYVVNKEGDWLEFAGKEEEMEWREEL